MGVPWHAIKLFLLLKTIFFRLFKHLILGARDRLLSEYSQHHSACADAWQKGYENIKLMDNGRKFVIIILLQKETRVTCGTRKHTRSHDNTCVPCLRICTEHSNRYTFKFCFKRALYFSTLVIILFNNS